MPSHERMLELARYAIEYELPVIQGKAARAVLEPERGVTKSL